MLGLGGFERGGAEVLGWKGVEGEVDFERRILWLGGGGRWVQGGAFWRLGWLGEGDERLAGCKGGRCAVGDVVVRERRACLGRKGRGDASEVDVGARWDGLLLS